MKCNGCGRKYVAQRPGTWTAAETRAALGAGWKMWRSARDGLGDETLREGDMRCPGCVAAIPEGVGEVERNTPLSERPELRSWLSSMIYAYVHDRDASEPTESELTAELDVLQGHLSRAAAVPEGTPTAEPATFAAVKISRCPNCNEFPEQWQSGGMPCTECGVDLESNIRVDADGAELWNCEYT